MTKITQGNNVYTYPQPQPIMQNNQYYVSAPQLTMNDEFVAQHKKNGLIERLYNGLKNLTGLGMGSKKVQKNIEKAENGEISEEEARASIEKYRKSQANSVQIAGDALSIGAAVGAFLKTKKYINENAPRAVLRKAKGVVQNNKPKNDVKNLFGDMWSKLKMPDSTLIKFYNNPKSKMITLGLGALSAAGMAKWAFGIVDRIGSKQYKTNKEDFNNLVSPYDKAAYQQARKYNRHERRKASFKNFVSGAVNGLLLPITGLVGGIVGVPLYFVANSLNRYFIGNSDESDKSFKSYFDNLKTDKLLHTALAAGFGVPIFIKTHNMASAEKAAKKAVTSLSHSKFGIDEFDSKSSLDEITEIIFKDANVRDIINKDCSHLTQDETQKLAQNLIDENFFAAKFKQIIKDNSGLHDVLAENMPPTRNLGEAQKYINDVFGNGKYTLDKDHYCLGVGTVAETYFAKSAGGEDVCIKVLKNGMNKEKITSDADKVADMIRNSGKSEAEQQVLLKAVEDLKNGVLKEIDLKNEFEAAQKLSKCTNYAKVVSGIEVKDNVYVMQRANGISLRSLMDLNEAYALRDSLQAAKAGMNDFRSAINGVMGYELMIEKLPEGSLKKFIGQQRKGNTGREMKGILDDYIKQVEAKTPTHGDIRLEPEDLKNLISEYQQVLVEQFNKVDKNGKVIHGDIHPGNIFIDTDALKQMQNKGKASQVIQNVKQKMGKVDRKNHNVFTLIDTGNVIELTKEQSLSLLNLSSYIEHGNYKKIAEYVMQGVEGDALGGRTKEGATKLVEEQLKKCFTDTTTPLDVMTNENLIKLTNNIMKNNGIVPNDTQLNLNKAMHSADVSLDALIDGLFHGRLGNGEAFQQLFGFGSGKSDSQFLKQIKKNMEKAQEKDNLRQLSSAERKQNKKLEGNLTPDSEEYWIYKLKQDVYEAREKKSIDKSKEFGLGDFF